MYKIAINKQAVKVLGRNALTAAVMGAVGSVVVNVFQGTFLEVKER